MTRRVSLSPSVLLSACTEYVLNSGRRSDRTFGTEIVGLSSINQGKGRDAVEEVVEQKYGWHDPTSMDSDQEERSDRRRIQQSWTGVRHSPASHRYIYGQ